MNIIEKVQAHFMHENGVSVADLALQHGVSEQVIVDAIADVSQRRSEFNQQNQQTVNRKTKLWEHVNVKK